MANGSDKEGALIQRQNALEQERVKKSIQGKATGVDIDAIRRATPEDSKEKGIEKLGKIVMKSGLKFVNQLTPRVEKEIEEKFNSSECLPQEEIDKAIALRENMVGQANQISRSLDSFTKTLLGVSKFLAIAIAVVKGIKTAKIILATISSILSVFPIPNPIVNQILGALNSVVGILDEIAQNTTFNFLGDSRLRKAKSGIDSAAISFSLTNAYIAAFVNKLNSLDAKIVTCDPSVKGTLSTLDPQLRLIAEIQKEAELSANSNEYQGFVIEVEEVPFSPTVNRKRAIGLNQDNIKLIETPLSFTSKDEFLIQELKFIIDRDNLKAY